MAPVLWDAVRFEVDKRGDTGLIILTGSAVPADNVTATTGTGRFSRMLMRSVSLFESHESMWKKSRKSSVIVAFSGEKCSYIGLYTDY